MLKLAFLLIGPQAFRSRWYVLAAIGAAAMVLALAIAAGQSEALTLLTQDALGLVFAANGVISMFAVLLGNAERATRRLILLKAIGLIALGSLIVGVPFTADIGVAILFGLLFALDGLGRFLTALIVRFSGWRTMIGYGVVELGLAALLISQWPLSHDKNIALCLSLLISLWGLLFLRFALMLRTLEDEVAILALPIFGGRGWYDHAPVLIDTDEPVLVEAPLTVHVWTPVGSAENPERRLLIDRYIAAVDGSGVISTGHAALEMLPDLYISHYPKREVDRSRRDFITSLRGTAENDRKGCFQTSYESEANWWCPADAHVEFRNYNPRRLRAFWIGYRQDSTYNLTNRNCSTVVAAALDAALEGSLDTKYPWLRLLGLLTNPDIWVASMICSRANSMTWTPGLVLDYARTMARIVEARELGWASRFQGFVRRLRPDPSHDSTIDDVEARPA